MLRIIKSRFGGQSVNSLKYKDIYLCKVTVTYVVYINLFSGIIRQF
jgi:hypothetical protein